MAKSQSSFLGKWKNTSRLFETSSARTRLLDKYAVEVGCPISRPQKKKWIGRIARDTLIQMRRWHLCAGVRFSGPAHWAYPTKYLMWTPHLHKCHNSDTTRSAITTFERYTAERLQYMWANFLKIEGIPKQTVLSLLLSTSRSVVESSLFSFSMYWHLSPSLRISTPWEIDTYVPCLPFASSLFTKSLASKFVPSSFHASTSLPCSFPLLHRPIWLRYKILYCGPRKLPRPQLMQQRELFDCTVSFSTLMKYCKDRLKEDFEHIPEGDPFPVIMSQMTVTANENITTPLRTF